MLLQTEGGIVMEETLLDMLKRHEGKNVNKYGRHIAYVCTGGKTTAAYGRNLTDVGISEEEAMIMLIHDLDHVLKDAHQIFPEFYSYSSEHRKAIIDMIFNLGKTGFLSFRKMIGAILDGDWERAAEEAEDSKWYKQIGIRGVEVVSMIFNG